jgi:hypothetical protein
VIGGLAKALTGSVRTQLRWTLRLPRRGTDLVERLAGMTNQELESFLRPR